MSADESKRPPLWLVAIGVLPAFFAVGIFVFIARIGIAHDESRCPFHEVETRVVSAQVSVREEARRCLPEMEEHRWLAIRGRAPPLELGRFPLAAERIDAGFPWAAREEAGRVVVTVTNVGRGDLVFREPAPDARAPQHDPAPRGP